MIPIHGEFALEWVLDLNLISDLKYEMVQVNFLSTLISKEEEAIEIMIALAYILDVIDIYKLEDV